MFKQPKYDKQTANYLNNIVIEMLTDPFNWENNYDGQLRCLFINRLLTHPISGLAVIATL